MSRRIVLVVLLAGLNTVTVGISTAQARTPEGSAVYKARLEELNINISPIEELMCLVGPISRVDHFSFAAPREGEFRICTFTSSALVSFVPQIRIGFVQVHWEGGSTTSAQVVLIWREPRDVGAKRWIFAGPTSRASDPPPKAAFWPGVTNGSLYEPFDVATGTVRFAGL